MLLELLNHMLNFDFGWLASFALDNIVMAFMLFAVIFIFLEGKKIVSGALVFFVLLLAVLDFGNALGITFFTGKFIAVYFISKVAVLSIAEGSKKLRGFLPLISELQFYAAFAVTAIFFR